jgi:hypothetical protein
VLPTCYAQSTIDAAGDLGGTTVILFGQGSVGLPLGQLTRVAGAARVVAVARRRPALEAALAAGADEVLDSSAPDFAARLDKLAAVGGSMSPSTPRPARSMPASPVHRRSSGPSLPCAQAARRRRLRASTRGDRLPGPAAQGLDDLAARPARQPGGRGARARAARHRAGERGLVPTVYDGIESIPVALDVSADKRGHGVALTPGTGVGWYRAAAMSTDLTGAPVLVTGAARGLGRELALALGPRGACRRTRSPPRRPGRDG